MMKKPLIILSTLIITTAGLTIIPTKALAIEPGSGLDNYIDTAHLPPNQAVIVPISIRHGLESQHSLEWPLKNPNEVLTSKAFKENQKRAQKAGGNIAAGLNQNVFTAFSNPEFYFLFYNSAVFPGCSRDYAIQRLTITKNFYDKHNKLTKSSKEYLVEIFKLYKNKELKKTDQHFKGYSLNQAFKRGLVVQAEIGCGEIPGVAQGDNWPFEPGILYKLVQDYSPTPQLYNQVQYDFATTYQFDFDFDRQGHVNFNVPLMSP